MSEFKFACPVCGQHITADSHSAGTELECPTCFRKIVVPQPPASADPKFILSAAEANKPRAPQASAKPALDPLTRPPEHSAIPLWIVLLLIAACAAGGTLFVFREKIFRRANSISHAPPPPAPERKRGGIGLGAWNTAVEYTNCVVTKGTQTLYQSDFAPGAPGWQIHSGIWTATNGAFWQAAIAPNCRATTGSNDWSDYTIRVRARKLGGREGFLILFNVADDRTWTWWNLGGWNNTRNALENYVAGAHSELGNHVPGRIENNRWYDVRVELSGLHIRCYLDDQLINEADYPSSPPTAAEAPGSPTADPAAPASMPAAGAGPWTLNLAGATLPETAASGEAHGGKFTCERAVLQGGTLHLRQGKEWPPDLGVSVYLAAHQGEELGGKSVNVEASDARAPRVLLRWKQDQRPETKTFNRGYAMKLEFSQPSSNRITGRIFLCLPDPAKSYVAGTFDAELRKPAPPGNRPPRSAASE